mgnify:CR=1 FL=1
MVQVQRLAQWNAQRHECCKAATVAVLYVDNEWRMPVLTGYRPAVGCVGAPDEGDQPATAIEVGLIRIDYCPFCGRRLAA